MTYKTDIEIATRLRGRCRSGACRARCGINEKYLEQYGQNKAKVALPFLRDPRPDGKLILVTAITPTPAGEGQNDHRRPCGRTAAHRQKRLRCAARTVSRPRFRRQGRRSRQRIRAQVVPMEDINLHFTGDFHAIGAAGNLLAAVLDNHLQQGNALGVTPKPSSGSARWT